jgi:hypothetical protein
MLAGSAQQPRVAAIPEAGDDAVPETVLLADRSPVSGSFQLWEFRVPSANVLLATLSRPPVQAISDPQQVCIACQLRGAMARM